MNLRIRQSLVIGLTILSALSQPGLGFAASNFDLQSAIDDTPMYDTTVYGCAASSSNSNNVVVLDPGHSGSNQNATTAEVDDSAAVAGDAADAGNTYQPINISSSGVKSVDNSGAPAERTTMMDAATKIGGILTKAGYKVVFTKNTANENVGLLQRAKIANDANAAIAVSLHFTGGVQFGSQSAHWGVTPQAVGESRTNAVNGKSYAFPASESKIATLSQQYATAIQAERSKAGDPVSVAPLDQSFPAGRGLPSYGNISIVQLFSKVPWVYNEDGDVGFSEQKYVTGIANGIMKAVPITAATASGGTGLPTLVGKDNVAKGMSYLEGALGLTPPQAAGLMGNLMYESGGGVNLVPNADQNRGTATSPTSNDGFGIAQWTDSGRQGGLVALAKQNGVPADNLAVQLLYVHNEFTGKAVSDYSSTLAALKKTTNVIDATTVVEQTYEAAGIVNMDRRIAAAKQALTLNAGGSPGPVGTTGSCAGASTSGNSIVQQAIKLAWPKMDCQQSFKDAGGQTETRGSCLDSTNAYKKAWDGASDQTDCGAFVASVMISSGADPKYPPAGTLAQAPYVMSNPKKYQIINTKSTAGLQPGDILVAGNEPDGTGHTALWVGPGYPGGTVAAASWHGHTPQLDGSNSTGEVVFILTGIQAAAARHIGG